MSPRIHLVRHGEVDNPHHVVYAGLPGYGLSQTGVAQAVAAAAHLADRPVTAVVSSPLQRARETARPLAAVHDLEVTVDEALTEWRLSERWAGVPWDDLPHLRPGELEAYLDHPADLPFSPESLEALADRMAAAIRSHFPADGDLVVVSHQDPIHAARRSLTGRGLSDFHTDKPMHASVITLDPGADRAWIEVGHWHPDQGAPFPPA